MDRSDIEKKWIIEIPKTANKIIVVGVYGDKEVYAYSVDVHDLDSYAEPDTEKVKGEAYEEGYKTAKVQCNIQAEKDLREVGERHYQKGYQDATVKISSDEQAIAEKAYQSGLNDAWKAARKFWDYDLDTLKEIFGWVAGERDVFIKYTAAEAIEKLRQREQEQKQEEEQIQVGDEVVATSGKAVIVGINDDKDKARYIYPDSTLGFDNICNLSKTGRHFPELAAVLAKMKEEP